VQDLSGDIQIETTTLKSIKMAIRDLDITIDLSERLIEYLNENGIDNSIEKFCFTAIDRLKKVSGSLKQLLLQLDDNHDLEYSCGILIRSIISDSLFILNSYILSVNDNQKLEEFCFIVLAVSVNHLIKNVDKELPLEKKEKAFNSIVDRYPEYFKGDRESGKLKFSIEKKVLNRVRNDTLILTIKESLTEYAAINQAYLYYSKYEHFGNIYQGFQAWGFEHQREKIFETIRLIPRLLMYLAHILCKENLLRNENPERILEEVLQILMKHNEAYFS